MHMRLQLIGDNGMIYGDFIIPQDTTFHFATPPSQPIDGCHVVIGVNSYITSVHAGYYGPPVRPELTFPPDEVEDAPKITWEN